MKHISLLIFFILLLHTGTGKAQLYVVVKLSEMRPGMVDSSKALFIPLSDEDLAKSKILDTTYKMLRGGKQYQLYRHLSRLKKNGCNTPDFYLAFAILEIYYSTFDSADEMLSELKPNEYPVLKELLKTDIKIESVADTTITDFEYYLKLLQGLADSCPDDAVLKRIIASRLHYIRYYN